MENSLKQKLVGIAGLFNESELKNIFLKYIQFIIVVEIIILMMMLAGYAANRPAPFPTKLYLFLGFGVPLAITFLLGAMIQAFGKYVYGDRTSGLDKQNNGIAQLSSNPTMNLLWGSLKAAPYLAKLVLFLMALSLVFYLEDMLGFMAKAGTQAFDSLIMVIIVLICGATLFGLFWAYALYRLKSKQMDYHQHYRKEILERLELMVLDDDTIVDKKGNLIPLKDLNSVENSLDTLDIEYTSKQNDTEEKLESYEPKN
jgi:hypothetical protein